MEPNIIISSLKGKEQNANAQENPLNMDVVKEERKSGVRKIGHRGFDVISQKFFVDSFIPADLLSAVYPQWFCPVLHTVGKAGHLWITVLKI